LFDILTSKPVFLFFPTRLRGSQSEDWWE